MYLIEWTAENALEACRQLRFFFRQAGRVGDADAGSQIESGARVSFSC